MGWKENKAQRDIAYARAKVKRVPFDIQVAEYDRLKEIAGDTAVNTYIKKALNAFSGEEIFKV